jgi:hypothetical protein
MNDADFHSDVEIPPRKQKAEVDESLWVLIDKTSSNRLTYFKCLVCSGEARRDYRIDHL